MENTNNNRPMSEPDVSSLDDVELFQQLREFGADVGPITNSTRAVYQRKLQRLVKHGSSNSVSASSPQSLDNSLCESPHIQPDIEPIIKYTKPTVREVNQSDSDDSDHSHHVSMKSKLNSIADTSSAIENSVPREKVGEHRVRDGADHHRHLPVVSQEDIELVDRVMAYGFQSTSGSTTSYQPTSIKDFKRAELVDSESVLRSRYSLHNVTPRQSLSSYKGMNATTDNVWTGLGSFSSTPVRQAPATPISSPASIDSPSGRNGLSTVFFIVVGVVVILLILAIIWNLEPAYSTPLKQ